MDNTVNKSARISRLGTLAAAAFVLTAGAAGGAMAGPRTQEAGQLDDAQIAGRVLAFDRAEVQTAEAIKGKLSSGPAWELAQRLTVDNTARDRQLEALASPNQPSAASDSAAGGRAAAAELANLSGDALDKAYVAREIKEHQAMLDALDSQLIPSARSEVLQRQLVELRVETAAQLAEAQAAQHRQNQRETAAQQPDFSWGP
jgi:putative membrane protein